jgi:hypothetical protein
LNGSFNILKLCRHQGTPGDQDNLPTNREGRQPGAHTLSEQPLRPISLNSPAHGTPGTDADLQCLFRGMNCNQYHKRVRVGFSFGSHPLEIGRSSQAKAALHPGLALWLASAQGLQQALAKLTSASA